MGATNLELSDFDDMLADMGLETATEQQLNNEKNVTAKPVSASTETVSITPVNAPLNPAVLQSAQAKMSQIFVEMNNLFVERDELIKLMELAIVTGTNLLMLGPPGTARVDIIA